MADHNSTSKISPKTFACPSCGANVTVRALGQTLVAVCGSCKSTIDTSNEQYQLIKKYIGKLEFEPIIPLGQKGLLGGILWQVLGVVRKTDTTEMYQWSEYILFNPYHGYRFLVENFGHWNFITMVRKHIGGDFSEYSKSRLYNGQYYDLFDEGSAKVIYVLGEFYWRVSVGDFVNTKDYIAPPRMLSVERDDSEEVWSEGLYIDASVIEKAFKLPSLLPPTGVGPNQPSPWGNSFKKVKNAFFIFIALIVACQFVHILASGNKIGASFAGTYTRGTGPGEGLMTTLEGFVVEPGEKNIEISLSTNITNNWFELSGQLIDEDGDEIRDFDLGTEFYSGLDADGSWSEGSQRASLFIPAIPAGKYKILFSYTGLEDPMGSQSISALVEIKKDVPMWQNFLIALTLLGSVFGLFALLVHSFESKRWSNSGVFYGSYDGDDD